MYTARGEKESYLGVSPAGYNNNWSREIYPSCSDHMNVMGTINPFLIECKALSREYGLCLAQTKNPWLGRHGPYGRAYIVILLNGHSTTIHRFSYPLLCLLSI